LIEEKNSQNLGYTLEINKFSDLTPEEFGEIFGSPTIQTLANSDMGMKTTSVDIIDQLQSNDNLPVVDWV